MNPEEIITGKYALVVDDEQDVLDTVEDLLDMCKLDTATTFQEAEKLLMENAYDIAILDIMGVDGYELLKIANSQNIPALMLTAQASTNENLYRLCEAGAAYYVPKIKMPELDTYLADVFQAIEEGKNSWERGLERLCISMTLSSVDDN
jgi:DNA-binding response OmpR family regulator